VDEGNKKYITGKKREFFLIKNSAEMMKKKI
jgi:hypothetical protein